MRKEPSIKKAGKLSTYEINLTWIGTYDRIKKTSSNQQAESER